MPMREIVCPALGSRARILVEERALLSVTITLPPSLEESLRRDVANLDDVAKEALLVELYRHEHITKRELAKALGIDRFAANDVLNRFGVTEELPTLEEIEGQLAAIEGKLDR